MKQKSILIIVALLLTAFFPVTVRAADGFEILPDYHLTPQWVKAGAYFKNNGQRVKVSHVNIHVMLPKSKKGDDYDYGVRDHDEDNVGEPDWSGHWDEPWSMGFFYYTVTATYNGQVHKKTFVVGRNKLFEALDKGVEIAKKIKEAKSAAGL